MMTFNEIYKKHKARVYFAIFKIVRNQEDAEELTTDAMIRVHKSLSTYNEELSKLSTWITRIAINTAIDHVRKKKLNVVPFDIISVRGDEDQTSPDHRIAFKSTELNPEEAMISNQTAKTMFGKLEKLSEVDKNVVKLHYFDGLSYDEVAAELNMPLGTIKAKLHKARVTLMEAFPVEMRKLSTIE